MAMRATTSYTWRMVKAVGTSSIADRERDRVFFDRGIDTVSLNCEIRKPVQ
jgi:hypothetical protein